MTHLNVACSANDTVVRAMNQVSGKRHFQSCSTKHEHYRAKLIMLSAVHVFVLFLLGIGGRRHDRHLSISY